MAAVVLFYFEELLELTVWHQLAYLSFAVAFSLLIDWLVANAKDSNAIEVKDGELELLGVTIVLAELSEVLYCQSKRFEHRLRFRFTNETYRDFEISSADLIDDLRFYHFLVDCGLSVKMLEDDQRLLGSSK